MLLSLSNRFRSAELGSTGCLALVLGLIAFIVIGLIRDFLTEVWTEHKEELPMNTKMKTKFAATVKSVLNSVWTMGANLLASALLI